jgi:hypothetical protein
MRKELKGIVQRYEEVNAVNGRKFTPRKGYYLVKRVYLSPIWNIYIAKCCWKEKEEDSFNLHFEVEIQFMSLYETSAKPESFDPESLRGSIVFISETYNDSQLWKGKEEPIVRCVWSKIDLSNFISPLIKFADLPSTLLLCDIYDDPDGHIDNYLDYENELIDEAFISADQDAYLEVTDGDDGQTSDDAYDAEDGINNANDGDDDTGEDMNPENGIDGSDNNDLPENE